MAKVSISREFILEAMQHEGVKQQLKVVADRVERRAQALAAADDVELETEVREFTRPGGRPVAQVVADNAAQEFGTEKVNRYRILGRAAEEVG